MCELTASPTTTPLLLSIGPYALAPVATPSRSSVIAGVHLAIRTLSSYVDVTVTTDAYVRTTQSSEHMISRIAELG
jgi:hypothetical protein